MILPPEPVSLSTASILKILLPEGAFCGQKELPVTQSGKPGELEEMKNEHARRQKKRMIVESI